MATNTPNHLHSLTQLVPGTKVEHLLTGQQFVVTANNGNRVTAVSSVSLVTVNDYAHTEWICATSKKPLNKLKVGDIITKQHSYVITSVSDYLLHATRSIEITNPTEYLIV
ncbi:hypothetical protein MACH09_42880 [Vibrio sp. MACH09]|uniref:hypothetical protein n=1 Tax=unclassified Vibrio TaxID=2614977 RepID=UPI001493D82E|nr:MULTISPECIES: hypothetical protein [unclassified Vibrio]NOI66032.1 hypothetical protein [Vibrio sp. 99-8-1]GLO63780.1 hypothetical protein MACH09_42880 [Vibrio sp. MACH09]